MSERSERVIDAAIVVTTPPRLRGDVLRERSERSMTAATSVLVTEPSVSEAQS
ncbi:hypothetical protein NBRGN_038_03060 [Nocardia brasiliensis NBRC 14402]|uniref:hypothetical protein n=1 Tax=Nocardia brasiliensis TaxID=37326 RepID=UPI0002E0ED5B|nr:hypothetical protein [Nocardia brasiliensis]GAJ81632.1 hypothetical protein NBRGN_038_03060 [Nocardia brasiliensis NBRC 14402]SUB40594.1 Uncharacterised protein [Nocardia brasiliensis]